MYVEEFVPSLLQSLLALSGPSTVVYVAHGRNRPAEPAFRAAACQHFSIQLVPSEALDYVYQCSDVDVLQLKRLPEQKPLCSAEPGNPGNLPDIK